MNTPLLYLNNHPNSQVFYQTLLHQSQPIYDKFKNLVPQRILLNQSDPVIFLSYFIAISSTHHQLFLGNPDWQSSEWQQVIKLVNPHLIIHNNTIIPTHFNRAKLLDNKPLIMIATGGTSGKIRFVMHNWQTLTASAQGFIDYFNLDHVNSFCLLPLYHVSGLMQFVRSLYSGGDFILTSYSEIKDKKRLNFKPNDYFISLVPTQLQYLLTDPQLTQWLAQFKTILLGGAPAWSDLLQQAQQANLPLSLTYGMTETASQIATLKPEDFLSGIHNCGQILPHAQIEITTEKVIKIQAKSLCLGYYPDYFPLSHTLETEDLGFLNEQGFLTIIGRKNQIIISGGENIIPEEVEQILRETQLIKDIVIMGIPDTYWGEKVIALYVPISSEITAKQLKNALLLKLAPYKHPKEWIALKTIPRNPQGKLNYTRLKQIVNQYFSQGLTEKPLKELQ